MKGGRSARLGVALGTLALAACSGSQRSAGGRTLPTASAIEIPSDDSGYDGTIDIRGEHAPDGGRTVAIAADAGIVSAETAWLVAHLGDDPDRAHSADSPNVRALAARGADGVRAVAPVLRRGDGSRVRFARRVLERVMDRACGTRDRVRLQRLALWLELGAVPEDDLGDAGIVVWTLPDEHAWAPEGMARLLAWAQSGLRCEPAQIATLLGGDGGIRTTTAASIVDAARDALVDASDAARVARGPRLEELDAGLDAGGAR